MLISYVYRTEETWIFCKTLLWKCEIIRKIHLGSPLLVEFVVAVVVTTVVNMVLLLFVDIFLKSDLDEHIDLDLNSEEAEK